MFPELLIFRTSGIGTTAPTEASAKVGFVILENNNGCGKKYQAAIFISL
jgi:hypothetical protein